MNETRCKHSNDEAQGEATVSDYEAYFEIPEVIPGSEAWRELISHLIDDIVVDIDLPRLSEKDTTSLVNSLRSVSEITVPDAHQLEK